MPSWSGQLLRRQHVTRDIDCGTVLGSPDIVLADRAGVWDTILELKLVSSVNSAVSKHLQGEPDSKNLIQSATYMWLTGKPVILCYTSRTYFALEFQRKKYGLARIEPFYRMYYLSFKDGVLFYRDEFEVKDVRTVITADGIERYYEQVARMGREKKLFDRPANRDVVQYELLPWSMCDKKYCPYAEACDRYEHDYNTWMLEVAQLRHA